MSVIANAESVASRPSMLRARADLIQKPISFRGTRYWSIKDPVTLRYYQLCDEEQFVLQQLDGAASLEQIQHAFEQRFTPRKLLRSHLHAFLGMLHREGLATSPNAGQGDKLLHRHQKSQRQQLLQRFTNVLAIRFRGVDPDRFLNWAYPRVRCLFSLPALLAALLLMLTAGLLVTTQFESVVAKFPNAFSLLGLNNILLLGLVLAVCKVLHELGHAFACKHFGGECHELGFMLLVFTPCLYCNVSDAWMIPSKWRRIAISAAGIYVELLLASVCTLLWWFSQPGLVNSVCLNVMVVCSVSTLFFNGNPLLRYDGYFILADLIERPNLRQQSQALLQRIASRFFTGREPDSSWIVPKEDRALLAGYGVASFAYRCFVIGAILFLVHRLLEPHRLEVLAQLLGATVLFGAVIPLMWQATRSARQPHSARSSSWFRLIVATLLLAAAFVGIGLLPVSRSVIAPVVLEPANAVRVWAKVPGQLKAKVRYGDHIDQAHPIAELSNSDVEQKVVALTGERDVWRQKIAHIERLQVRDRQTGSAGVGNQLLTAKEALAAIERQLVQAQRDQQDFRVTSPTAGIILPPRNRLAELSDETLPMWSGCPLDELNQGCFIDADTVLCLIGDSRKLKGTVLVSQQEVERIEDGQTVTLFVEEFPNEQFSGTVTEIARLDADQLPRELTQKRMVKSDAEGRVEPSAVYFSVTVSIELSDVMPPIWSSGRAKITVTPRTLGRAVYEQLCQTFRIDL
ncbi:MAG: hypothetical protein CMJ64_26210 [Planctomycetaceae bacterium]|nr:hypothetical protein [Planctomycetaceae bacterium]